MKTELLAFKDDDYGTEYYLHVVPNGDKNKSFTYVFDRITTTNTFRCIKIIYERDFKDKVQLNINTYKYYEHFRKFVHILNEMIHARNETVKAMNIIADGIFNGIIENESVTILNNTYTELIKRNKEHGW